MAGGVRRDRYLARPAPVPIHSCPRRSHRIVRTVYSAGESPGRMHRKVLPSYLTTPPLLPIHSRPSESVSRAWMQWAGRGRSMSTRRTLADRRSTAKSPPIVPTQRVPSCSHRAFTVAASSPSKSHTWRLSVPCMYCSANSPPRGTDPEKPFPALPQAPAPVRQPLQRHEAVLLDVTEEPVGGAGPQAPRVVLAQSLDEIVIVLREPGDRPGLPAADLAHRAFPVPEPERPLPVDLERGDPMAHPRRTDPLLLDAGQAPRGCRSRSAPGGPRPGI